jgi:hypothetical protein
MAQNGAGLLAKDVKAAICREFGITIRQADRYVSQAATATQAGQAVCAGRLPDM